VLDRTPRRAPAWLTAGDTVDEVLGPLKTGKEAEVLLVERRRLDGRERSLLVHKRYRPWKVGYKGELQAGGFAKARTFTTDQRYNDGRRIRNSRDARAVAGKTSYGRQVAATGWADREIEALRRAAEAGVSVPYLVEPTGEGALMELVGDEHGAAPRLVDARLDTTQVAGAHEQLREDVALLLRAGLVHADLSPYNVLWWDDRAWLIDLPQAVDVGVNDHALNLLHHDVTTMATWFRRKGLAVDGEAWFAELLTEAF
jgi:RIO kinase 1